MGFWGKLGKIALKAAPIAAAFIPGVGPLASMAIGGAANAASKKLEGGTWKQALGAGAMGAGTSALSSAIGGGFAKTPAGMTKAPLSTLQKVGKGVTAGLGGLGIVQEELANRNQSGSNNKAAESSQGQGIGPSSAPSGINGRRDLTLPARNTYRGSGPRGLPYGMGAGQTPDLSSAFARGRNTAIMNQPFRAGAPPFQRMNDETGMMEDIPGDTGRPPIYPNFESQGDNMFGSALGGAFGGMMGGGQRRPPMQGGGGIGPSQPPGGMQQTHVVRPPAGRNMSGGPGPVLNRPMQPPSLGMGMAGGSQFRPPGMPQFNPGMSMMRPAVMPYGAQRATDGGLQTGGGIGPSNDPMQQQMQQQFGAMAQQDPAQGLEQIGQDMGIGPSQDPNNQIAMNKQMMMQQQPPMPSPFGNRMNQQPGMSYLMNRGRGGMNRNMPMGGMMY